MASNTIKGVMRFPGINKVLSGTFALTQGPTPSTGTIEIIPQANIPQTSGTLTITDGRETVEFPDCLLDQASFVRDARGRIVSLSILDRRHRWQWGRISGRYNVPRSGNQDDDQKGTVKSPQQLAELCFRALNETQFDATLLPDLDRPYIEWPYDTNPAEALASLCEGVQCRLGLGIDNVARVWRVGQGNTLPTDRVLDYTAGARPGHIPDAIVIATAPILFQLDLELEAVGRDVTGMIRPVNELSYMPEGGWGNVDAEQFYNVSDGEYEDSQQIDGLEKVRELAKSCVFRWYRVKDPVRFTVPPIRGAEFVHPRRLILPLENEQVEYYEDDDGSLRRRPAIVYGVWTNWPTEYPDPRMTVANLHQIGEFAETVNLPLGKFPVGKPITGDDYKAIVTTDFSLDRERGIVMFSKPVQYYDEADGTNGTWGAAKLYLRTAVTVRDEATRTQLREEIEQKLTPEPKYRLYRIHNDIKSWFIGKYALSPWADGVLALTGYEVQSQDVRDRAQYYIGQLTARYLNTTQAETVRYMGIRRIDLDGAIRQVSWSVGPGGATTTASRNDERPDETLTYDERRLRDHTLLLTKIEQSRERAEANLP